MCLGFRALGCLSPVKDPKVESLDSNQGSLHFQKKLDFSGGREGGGNGFQLSSGMASSNEIMRNPDKEPLLLFQCSIILNRAGQISYV